MTQADITDTSSTSGGNVPIGHETPTRDQIWVASVGSVDGNVIHAHKDGTIKYVPFEPSSHHLLAQPLLDLEARLDLERAVLSPSATFSEQTAPIARDSLSGIKTGNTPYPELAFRTRFERDRDSILHSEPFRRLAGKTQVHLKRDDHQRTRLTHALEVSQIASAISQALRLNVALTEAIALGHDCGHGPGGHASEDALRPYLPGGFNHATFGADVTLRSMDLCDETLDGIRNHSWSLHLPQTPEGEVVSFADRIAYVCHDLEDALSCGMISRRDYPLDLAPFLNRSRAEQIDNFIRGVLKGTLESGTIAITREHGELLGAMRAFNTECIYKNPLSIEQNEHVIATLSELVEFFAEHPEHLPDSFRDETTHDSDDVVSAVVEYVAGMTDDYAYRLHAQHVKHDPVTNTATLYLM